jgi:hypothetical protein
MNQPSPLSAKASFEEALLCGEARGYVVCAKPLRFALLPDSAVDYRQASQISPFFMASME